ncbi:hypothetical protein [Devosia sp.]|uniref:hypothetical protein n=1 Tax=Devosia sp. TaxID=1871048 RepID=UPI0035AE9E13
MHALYRLLLLMAALGGADVTLAQQLGIASGSIDNLAAVVVTDLDNDRSFSLLDNGTLSPLADGQLVGERYSLTDAVLEITLNKAFGMDGPKTLIIPLQFSKCLAAPCEARTVRIPNLQVNYSPERVQDQCKEPDGSGFAARTEDFLYCQAAYNFLAATGSGGSETADIALNGWYRSAFTLHTFHRQVGVHFVRPDQKVIQFVATRVKLGKYVERTRISPDSFAAEQSQIKATVLEPLQYIDKAIKGGVAPASLKPDFDEIDAAYRAYMAGANPPTFTTESVEFYHSMLGVFGYPPP